jgi:hypothetical protein
MYSKTPDILAYPSTIKHKALSQSQLDSLKSATLSVLQDVGVRFPSQKRLKSLQTMALKWIGIPRFSVISYIG